MGKLFVLRCARCKHPAELHPSDGKRCKGHVDGKGQPVVGPINRGWDYCACYRTQTEIEKAAESKRYFDLERKGA
jgi:hypothetical protein